MKTILITGATGVLAKKFTSRFSARYKIIQGGRNLDQNDSIRIDSWNEIKTTTKVDAVLHFAGKYLIDDSLTSSKQVNDAVVGTAAALAEFCRENKTPLVALGSYFEQAPLEMQPWSHYSIAKQSASKILELASLNYEIPMRYVYSYDTYGEDLSRRKIVDVLLDPDTEKLELSPGNQKLNLTHENDFVEATAMILEELMVKGGTFEKIQIRHNNDEFTLREVAETVNLLRGKKIDLSFGAKSYRKKEVFEVWDSAPNLPGWLPKIQFKDFVRKFLGDTDE